MSTFLYYIKRFIPGPLFRLFQPPYHYILNLLGALYYGLPSRKMIVIGVTGTKGKSTVTELVNALFEADGKRTALLNTIRFKIDQKSEPNKRKMTMPGRFFMQRFLHDAAAAGCDIAILEMTSEGVKQSRHRWIDLDALIFTNLSPEHIESHGSYEKYVAAKLRLARALERSRKRPRYMIANVDDEYGEAFLDVKIDHRLPYSLRDLELYTLKRDGVSLVIEGSTIHVSLVGLFNVYNALAAITCARAFSIPLKTIARALSSLPPIHGRVEIFTTPKDAKKQLRVVVDYAHTPDSLEKLYKAFEKEPKICVLGNTGGGRDTWKRPEMGRIAETYCERVILTNEDPYDEDPRSIVEAMRKGITNEGKVRVIMDRKEAIKSAIEEAKDGSVVLISGKGTDPYIMGPKNTKVPWSDAAIVKEILGL